MGNVSNRLTHRHSLVSYVCCRRCASLTAAYVALIASTAMAEDPIPGAPLSVAVRHIEPFVYLDQDKPEGFSIDVIEAIGRKLDRPITYLQRETVEDLLDTAQRGEANLAIAAISITASREAKLDFSHPFYRTGLRIAVPSRHAPSWLSTLRRFASWDFLSMLATIGGITLLAAHLLWAIEHRCNPESFPASYAKGVGEALWWSVATIITGGCENKAPVSLLGRLVAVAWMLGSIVLVASFTATLASQMTSESVVGAIDGPNSLPGHVVATIGGTLAEAELRGMEARVLPCPTIEAAIDAAVIGRADAVVFDAPVLAHAITNAPDKPIHLVGPMFEHSDYGIAMPRGSELRKSINQALLELVEGGELVKLQSKWFGERE